MVCVCTLEVYQNMKSQLLHCKILCSFRPYKLQLSLKNSSSHISHLYDIKYLWPVIISYWNTWYFTHTSFTSTAAQSSSWSNIKYIKFDILLGNMSTHIIIGNLHKDSYSHSLIAWHIHPIYKYIVRKNNSPSFCYKVYCFTFKKFTGR